MKKRLLVIVLAFVTLCTSAFVGCGAGTTEVEYDTTRTQLFVGNVSGGLGEDWLKDVITRFEAKYAETSFEDGKKGVEVIEETSTSVSGNSIGTSLNTMPYQVYFSEQVYYYDYVNRGDFADITDIVTEKLTEFGETKSIKDKLTTEYESFLNSNGKYYALPHWEDSYVATYDVDMFDRESLFFEGDGTSKNLAKRNSSQYVFTNKSGTLSSGPDGVSGNYDDGLPATIEQFLALCEKMKSNGITPINFSGTYSFYMTRWLTALAMSLAGEEAHCAYDFSGTSNNIVKSIDVNGNAVLESVTFDETNQDKGLLLNGKYETIKLIGELVNNGYLSQSSKSSYSHLQAQRDFIKGSFKSVKSGTEKFGMLIDGTFWENEASTFFETEAETYGDDALKENRNFAVMPMPHIDEDHLGETYILTNASTPMAFISSKTTGKQLELAKKFLQFCYTDESLSAFTAKTNVLKSLNYEVSESDKSELSNYGRSVIEYFGNATKIYPFSKSARYIQSPATYGIDAGWDVTIKGTTYSSPLGYFRNATNATAKEYMEAMIERYGK